MMMAGEMLKGPRHVLLRGEALYPVAFERLKKPPERIYLIGDPSALSEGLAVVGARSATPYGISCAERFSKIASRKGISIISGGARGCDSAAHRAALGVSGKTVAFMGAGCDVIYPSENRGLFQRIIDNGGAIASEYEWAKPAIGYQFRMRNRLIASLSKATLIVEAGLPSGTFSTADEALSSGREVLVIPGSISSRFSHGANRLIYQGATPIIDDETFGDQISSIFGIAPDKDMAKGAPKTRMASLERDILDTASSAPCTLDSLLEGVSSKRGGDMGIPDLLMVLSDMQRAGRLARYPDGTYGPVVDVG